MCTFNIETDAVNDFGALCRSDVVTVAGDADTIQSQRQVKLPNEVGDENDGAIYDGNDGEFLSFINGIDFSSELLEACMNGRLVEDDLFEIVDRKCGVVGSHV